MDGGWLTRLRWRRRGAWMWPFFLARTFADAVIGHQWPPSGDSWNPVGAGLVGCFLNLLAIVVLSVPLRCAVRRLRPALPVVVAKDYAGTTVMVVISALLLTAGLLHQPLVKA